MNHFGLICENEGTGWKMEMKSAATNCLSEIFRYCVLNEATNR